MGLTFFIPEINYVHSKFRTAHFENSFTIQIGTSLGPFSGSGKLFVILCITIGTEFLFVFFSVCTVLMGIVMQVAELNEENIANATERLCHYLPNYAQTECLAIVDELKQIIG